MAGVRGDSPWRRLQPAGSALSPSLFFDARDSAEMSLGAGHLCVARQAISNRKPPKTNMARPE